MKFPAPPITYNSIASRQDKLFHKRCRQQLGIKLYMQLVPNAEKAFKKGYREEKNINKRINVARRMANMVFTQALMDYWND